MHFEIRRGFHDKRPLTAAQRQSGQFAEEPLVLGKVLRRGLGARKLTEDEFARHRSTLLKLLRSESIELYVIGEEGEITKLSHMMARRFVTSKEASVLKPGDEPPKSPASSPGSQEESEALPPSSAAEEPPSDFESREDS